ncbi:hypothetical protein PV08_05130 [Exophiala spinifera]|uniref:FAD-dependent oxidoreductase 2 FAD-binding domain-containing protein n=1 Tax=Exophiala spinifera TaxID=91928 RepID=A0A0D2BH38_9EURO|nr:uncharacterized protein PV08_05130 [Exophiala spinifera]KIW17935.1 hypothetical protein PV08_05130 [Exophiala spinifera]
MVEGIAAKRGIKEVTVKTSHRVILATGGFAKNQETRAQCLQQPANPAWSSVPAHDMGDAIRAGMDIEAVAPQYPTPGGVDLGDPRHDGTAKSVRQAPQEVFLHRASALEDLCDNIGVSKNGLAATMQRFNAMAHQGRDEDFDREGSSYDQYLGDTSVQPNPNLGPIKKVPFYGVKVFLGDLGTKGGHLTNENGQVLAAGQRPTPMLYTSGNATASVMGRRYRGAGETLGPTMTFACLAVDLITKSSKV